MQQEDIHTKVEVALQKISHCQKTNSIPPPRISNLRKDEMLIYKYTIESWKSEADVVKASLENVEDLIEGVWNSYSHVIEEWGICEIEESLETFMSRVDDVEQARASAEETITNLLVLDAEAMEF